MQRGISSFLVAQTGETNNIKPLDIRTRLEKFYTHDKASRLARCAWSLVYRVFDLLEVEANVLRRTF